ncbi:MAG: hypothetical protein M3Y87_01805 [Myxococcota bacterium]|nr:hypothetical protein [Myxococcota bacterium]
MRSGTKMMMVCAATLAAFAMMSGCKSSSSRGGGLIACTPGSRVEIACGAGCGLGSCTGDAFLNICDGTIGVGSCNDSTDFASNDDGCGSLCPGLTVVCPESGALTVSPRAFGSRSFTCDWESRVTSSAPLTSESPDAGR